MQIICCIVNVSNILYMCRLNLKHVHRIHLWALRTTVASSATCALLLLSGHNPKYIKLAVQTSHSADHHSFQSICFHVLCSVMHVSFFHALLAKTSVKHLGYYLQRLSSSAGFFLGNTTITQV